MVGLSTKVGRIDGLNKVTNRHCCHVHVDSELKFPRAYLGKRVDTRKPKSEARVMQTIQPNILDGEKKREQFISLRTIITSTQKVLY